MVWPLSAAAQSTSQSFPTPVASSEISGTIPARDIGDSRVTTYYYTFEGSIGDVFVNVATKNFTGDVDIFADNGLRPLSKIVVYADLAENETGRVIYLRKPEKLLLRVQGRSPGDETASYRIKFAGSFVAAKESDAPAEPELPKVTAKNETGIRVNSVGTIIEVAPTGRRTETPRETAAVERAAKTEPTVAAKETAVAEKEPETAEPAKPEELKPTVITTETLREIKTEKPARTRSARRTTTAKNNTLKRTATPAAADAPAAKAEDGPPEADPLANIHLVIQFKDGKSIERPMNEVFKFSVDKGVLTVVSKDGRIGKYSILEVEKVTIQ
jgi:hypothetical protein